MFAYAICLFLTGLCRKTAPCSRPAESQTLSALLPGDPDCHLSQATKRPGIAGDGREILLFSDRRRAFEISLIFTSAGKTRSCCPRHRRPESEIRPQNARIRFCDFRASHDFRPGWPAFSRCSPAPLGLVWIYFFVDDARDLSRRELPGLGICEKTLLWRD